MSQRSEPEQPRPSQAPTEVAHQQEEELRRFSMRDRLLQLFDWIYPYGRERRDDERD